MGSLKYGESALEGIGLVRDGEHSDRAPHAVRDNRPKFRMLHAQAEVVDLMERLRRSLDQRAAKQRATKKAAAKKRTRRAA